MTEDDELLARIGRIAGLINRNKNQPHQTGRGGHSGAPYSTQNVHHRNPAGWRPYRGRSRPSPRGGGLGPHRHRTLVLNNQGQASDKASGTESGDSPADVSNEEAGAVKPGQHNGWIAKRDRHMQLINSSIFDQETQARNKAIEETRKNKVQKKAHREEAMVLQHAQQSNRPQYPTAPATGGENQDPKSYTIFVHDMPFKVVQGGSKLIRQSDDPTTANGTPKRTKVGGVTFVRSKNGNLHRLGAVVSKKKPGPPKKKNELCKRFTSMGTCFKGPSCPYMHDPNKVAICKDFLQTGKCDAGMACDLSHEPSPERSPACLHFLRGRCSNPSCRYAHIRVTPGAPVCRDFAILGYCSKGATCEERHVHECPDYANTGSCSNKKCPLPHVDRAGQIRKFATNKTEKSSAEGESEEDISSEEEAYDQIDSDDIDSDDLAEPEEITPGVDKGEASAQQDFIGF